MRRRILAILGLGAVGAGALLIGRVNLPPLPVDLEPWSAATQPPSATAPASSSAEAPAPVEAQGQAAAPAETTLDVARISPDGSSVLAGRSKPGSYVTLLEDGKPVGSVKADENGEWSIVTEHRFASLDPHLSFQASDVPPAPPQSAPSEAPIATASVAPDAAERAASTSADQPGRTAEKPATEILKKFESLVAEAREEAKREMEFYVPASASVRAARHRSLPLSSCGDSRTGSGRRECAGALVARRADRRSRRSIQR